MKSYIKYNPNLIVNLIKLDSEMFGDIDNAIKKKELHNSSTILYNNFSLTLDAIYFNPSTVYSSYFCSIYRKTPSQNYFDYVCTLNGEIEVKDYNIHNKDHYEYLAVIGIEQSDGTYDYILYENKDENDKKQLTSVEWNSWSICNIEESETSDKDNIYYKTGKTWLLGLNLDSENLTQNLNISAWDTLGVYPKIAYGQRNYHSSSMTCLLGQMGEVTELTNKSIINQDGSCSTIYSTFKEDKIYCIGDLTIYNEIQYKLVKGYDIITETGETVIGVTGKWNSMYWVPVTKFRYSEKQDIADKNSREIDKLVAWKKFCADGELKLLKDVKGNAWIVQISEPPTSNIDTKAFNSPTTITFNWKEVLNIDDISIISKKV